MLDYAQGNIPHLETLEIHPSRQTQDFLLTKGNYEI